VSEINSLLLSFFDLYFLHSGNKQVAAVIAFSLALFSHILNHVMMRLQTAIYELENPRKAFNSGSPVEEGQLSELLSGVVRVGAHKTLEWWGWSPSDTLC